MPKKLIPLLALVLTCGACAKPAVPPVPSDLIICANVNRGYVIGSTIVTTNGLFRLDAAGVWRHFGYNDTTITAVAFDPRDHGVIYTAALNGLWRSLDGGDNWRMLNSWDLTEGLDVAVDPNAPDHVYLAHTAGVAVSTDRGDTLEHRNHGLPERGRYAKTIEIDRTTAGRVFVGCETGIYLTENAGRDWRLVLPATATVNDVQQSPHDPAHWIAATDDQGVWSSHDRGLTWQRLAALADAHAYYNVAFDPSTPGRIVVGGWHPGVRTSEDGGATWTDRNAGLPENARAWRVGVHPATGRLYASIVEATLYFSDDFGRTWQPDVLEGSLVNCFVSLPRAQP